MKKLLFLLLVPLVSFCDNINEDFFVNHQNRIWADKYEDEYGSATYYTRFINRTVYTVDFANGGNYNCETLFIGEKNSYSNENSDLALQTDLSFGKGTKVNVTSEIIVNKANELQIENIAKSLDGSINVIVLMTYKVNVDSLIITRNYKSASESIIETYRGSIYKGNLDISFNEECNTRYFF